MISLEIKKDQTTIGQLTSQRQESKMTLMANEAHFKLDRIPLNKHCKVCFMKQTLKSSLKAYVLFLGYLI